MKLIDTITAERIKNLSSISLYKLNELYSKLLSFDIKLDSNRLIKLSNNPLQIETILCNEINKIVANNPFIDKEQATLKLLSIIKPIIRNISIPYSELIVIENNKVMYSIDINALIDRENTITVSKKQEKVMSLYRERNRINKELNSLGIIEIYSNNITDLEIYNYLSLSTEFITM